LLSRPCKQEGVVLGGKDIVHRLAERRNIAIPFGLTVASALKVRCAFDLFENRELENANTFRKGVFKILVSKTVIA